MPLDDASQLELILCSRELSAGILDAQNFLSKLQGLTDDEVSLDELEYRVLAEAVCATELKEIIKDLQEEFVLWLFADLPPSWVQTIVDTSHLEEVFPSERLLNLNVQSKAVDDEGLIRGLIKNGELHWGSALLVDRNARRSSTAIRMGLDAAIYVDPRRLRRDFRLWGIFPFDV